MKKYEVSTPDDIFMIESDCFKVVDGILEFIKDHFIIALFKNWDYVIEINDQT